jgi:hypothetical protein
MVRISITEQAFIAIASTLALGSVGFENPVNENGERLIWLERSVVDRPFPQAVTQIEFDDVLKSGK